VNSSKYKFIVTYDLYAARTKTSVSFLYHDVYHMPYAETFHADRQTDTTKLTVAFLSLANAPKKTEINVDCKRHADNSHIVSKL